MSSRYSRRPSSCSFWALGFICAMDSTSPYHKPMNGSAFHHKTKEEETAAEAEAEAYLKDEETLVIKINATLLKGISDLGEVAGLVVDIVLTLATPGHIAHHNILQQKKTVSVKSEEREEGENRRGRKEKEDQTSVPGINSYSSPGCANVRKGQEQRQRQGQCMAKAKATAKGKWKESLRRRRKRQGNKARSSYQVNDVDKVHSDTGSLEVWELCRVVNQIRELSLTHLFGFKPKHKQHSINHIGLATSIRANNRGKGLKEKEEKKEEEDDDEERNVGKKNQKTFKEKSIHEDECSLKSIRIQFEIKEGIPRRNSIRNSIRNNSIRKFLVFFNFQRSFFFFSFIFHFFFSSFLSNLVEGPNLPWPSI